MATKAEKKARIRAAYEEVFIRHPQGQVVFRDLLSESSFLSPTFTPGDSHAMAHNEGQRSVMLYILNQLQFANVHTASDILNQGRMHAQEAEDDPLEGILGS